MARNPLVPGIVLPSYAQVRDKARQVMAGTSVDPVPTAETDIYGNPVEHDIDPVPEGRPPFIPYRGEQWHGLDPQTITTDPQNYGDGTVDVVYDADPAPDHVLNVRVVRDSKEEISAFRVSQTSIGPNATAIMSRQRNRTKLKIRHLGTSAPVNVRVWIGHNESVNAFNGFPLDPGESLEMTSTEIVYAVSSTSDVIPLAMWSDFTQDV